MWRELHAAPLLAGYRGAPAMDTDALQQLILKVAELAEDFPEVSEPESGGRSSFRRCGSRHRDQVSPSARTNQTRTPGVWLRHVRNSHLNEPFLASPIGTFRP
jgi:hypothetical protein